MAQYLVQYFQKYGLTNGRECATLGGITPTEGIIFITKKKFKNQVIFRAFSRRTITSVIEIFALITVNKGRMYRVWNTVHSCSVVDCAL